MSKIAAIWTALSGKKTYLIALLVAGLAFAQAFGVVIPDWVWTLLSAAGLGTLRDAVNKVGADQV